MRLCTTVIFTDQLAAVRDFYQAYFLQFPGESSPNRFNMRPFAEAQITWIDAALSGTPVTQGALFRISVPYTLIEHAEMAAKGAPCSALTVEDWGPSHGRVQYFTVTDPSGTRFQFYEDHFGEDRQLMTTGDGTGTREVQKEQA